MNEIICSICGEIVVIEDAIEANGKWYCQDCFDGNCFVCSECGETRERGTEQTVNGQEICDRCFDETYVQCTNCNAILYAEDAIEADGYWYCEDCHSDIFYECNECGRSIYKEDATMVGGDILCEDCFEYYYATCDRCGRWVHVDNTVADGYSRYCEDCFNDYYFCCNRCGEIYPLDDAYIDGCGNEYCLDCADVEGCNGRVIHDYCYRPTPVYYGGFDDGRVLLEGVELEIDRGDGDNDDANYITQLINDDNEFVYCKHDGSLDNGFEIVSHPATLEYHWQNADWKSVMKRALERGYRSHDAGTAGLHVHINKNFFGHSYDEQDKNIMKLLFLVEKFWKQIVNFSRRTEAQLERWAKRYGLYDNPETLLDVAKGSERYRCVNLQNADTVEIRMFRGTLKYETFIATLQFCEALAKTAVNTSVNEVQTLTWDAFVEALPEEYIELTQYLEKRKLLPSTENESPIEELDDGTVIEPPQPIPGCECPVCREARNQHSETYRQAQGY